MLRVAYLRKQDDKTRNTVKSPVGLWRQGRPTSHVLLTILRNSWQPWKQDPNRVGKEILDTSSSDTSRIESGELLERPWLLHQLLWV